MFCDRNAGALKVVRANIGACGVGDRARAVGGDVMAPISALGRFGPFDLVFLDPPYDCEPAEIMGMVQRLDREGLLDDDTLVVYEHRISDRDRALRAAADAGWRPVKCKKFGETAVDLLVRE